MDVLPRTRRRWIGWAVILVAVTAILLVAGGIFLFRPSLASAERAYDRGDWPSAVANAAAWREKNPGDERAIRLEARSRAQMGQPFAAMALMAKLGGDRREAEDLFLVGRALLVDKQSMLGWAAIDAASKLDPKNIGAAETLAGRSRETGAGGKSDRLSAFPNGPALAELIVGLATLGEKSNPGDHDHRLLDRMLLHDRSAFLKIDSPASARKLLARLLLEEGKAREAREWIGSIDEPEAHWLLSRAALVEGDRSGARSSVKRAGTFGLDDPLVLELRAMSGRSSAPSAIGRSLTPSKPVTIRPPSLMEKG